MEVDAADAGECGGTPGTQLHSDSPSLPPRITPSHPFPPLPQYRALEEDSPATAQFVADQQALFASYAAQPAFAPVMQRNFG